MAACPTGALFKVDGMTRLNRDVCIGCEYCTASYPFDVPNIVDGLPLVHISPPTRP